MEGGLENDLRVMENLIMKFYTQKKQKSIEIGGLMSEHRMISKTNKIVMKTINKVTTETEDQQIEFENLENEISRVR